MRIKKTIFGLLLILCPLFLVAQNSNTTSPVVHHLNKIDDIKTLEEAERFANEIFKRKCDFELNDSIFLYQHMQSYLHDDLLSKAADSFHVVPMTKTDFDGNGYTDILLVGLLYGDDFTTVCIMDSGNNRFVVKLLNSNAFSQNNILPVLTHIGYTPAIQIYYLNDDSISRAKKLWQTDKLIYKFDGFIEWNPNPINHKFSRINFEVEFLNSFALRIDSNLNFNFSPREGYEVEGEYSGKIDIKEYQQLISLLKYIDLKKLRTNYSIEAKDAPIYKLKITYDNDKTLSVNDIGACGTYSLLRLYQMLFELQNRIIWSPDNPSPKH